MPLGLESGTVRVVPYDPAWPQLFEAEASRLNALFAVAQLEVSIEHSGSTAVHGLSAKPVLDILVGYPANSQPAAYIDVLSKAGYDHRGQQGIPSREFFRRGNPRAYHLHLTAIDGAFWMDHLTFRDRLRADDALRDAYARLKCHLAATYPRDREAYIDGKTRFVSRVLAE